MTSKKQSSLEHFSKRSNEWEGLYQRPHFRDRLILFMEETAKVVTSENATLLDYGCGTGTLANALSVKFCVTGVDGAIGMIEKAKGLYTSSRINFQLIDPTSWTGCIGAYDGIVCSSVIEYVLEDNVLLSLLAANLKQEGYLLISVPNGFSMMNHLRNFLRSLTRRDSDSKFAQHLYFPKELDVMFEQCGLVIERTVCLSSRSLTN